MYKLKENVVDEILPKASEPKATLWLEEEVNNLARNHNGLDDIPLASIYVMAQLYVDGPCDEKDLAKSLEMDVADVLEYLEFLCERNFAEEQNSGLDYRLTASGEGACRDVGKNMIIRKRFEMKGYVSHLDAMYRNLEDF